ncbi:MAG: deoxyribodipyrimidine photolyase, partial [Bacteroidota bacterium]
RLSEFLVDFPKLSIHPCLFEDFHKEFITENSIPVDWNALIPETTNRSKGTGLLWISPGEHAATLASAGFIADGLDRYAENRNYPDLKGQSDLSPYLHFGQISSHRLALDLSNAGLNHESKQAFLEELIVRRELSDNFCYYNAHYDTVDGFPSWAKLTLKKHRDDPRDFIYSTEQFENAETHDDLWNSAQRQMVRTGKMHGFLRMYWAKKILEWTAEPEVAMAIAIYLNDKYEFDGRDPNGYAGIAWSIGGVHDRPWGERRVFGMIRYMNYQGCKRKFDVGKYIRQNELY